MPPIDLDNIIHYDPSAKRPRFETRQVLNFKSHPYSESLFRPIPSPSPPLDQHWRPGIALSAHMFPPSSFSYNGKSGMSIHPSKSADEAAMDFSYQHGMELSAVNLDRDTRCSVSMVRSTNMDIRVCPGGGFRPGWHDQSDDSTCPLFQLFCTIFPVRVSLLSFFFFRVLPSDNMVDTSKADIAYRSQNSSMTGSPGAILRLLLKILSS